ncbi:alkyl hydroperoxide reductase [Desulfuribacillus stibiiarsenatis]|uniref:Alkyl hydroperoxide reductase n=1 Tax=Desulfuribacillus stibiiarsenatis TaxID=1390249 RepID=A0A1E5L9U1_9FIRM|nr:alkyl hydroperoxide reductase [Desulfuribacillus stibiiarsenatis]
MPSYEKEISRFEGLNTQVLGISVDSVPSHEAWQKSLGGISFPLGSDFYPHGAIAQKYGVLREEGISERALFIIDKDGIVQYIDVHPIEQQPDNEEIFKVLEKLQ